jgi:hypothetical protein
MADFSFTDACTDYTFPMTTTWDTCSTTTSSTNWQPYKYYTYKMVDTTATTNCGMRNTTAIGWTTTPIITPRIYTGANFWSEVNYYEPPKTAKDRIKDILQRRTIPNIIANCKPLGHADDIREIRARETLRNVIGEDKFRDFARRGSISVRAKSGLVYQIFPGSGFTNVYNSGKMVDRLCVVLTGGFPPTDSLIMRYLMILNNEEQFKSLAIKHGLTKPIVAQVTDRRSLTEIFKELKKVA